MYTLTPCLNGSVLDCFRNSCSRRVLFLLSTAMSLSDKWRDESYEPSVGIVNSLTLKKPKKRAGATVALYLEDMWPTYVQNFFSLKRKTPNYNSSKSVKQQVHTLTLHLYFMYFTEFNPSYLMTPGQQHQVVTPMLQISNNLTLDEVSSEENLDPLLLLLLLVEESLIPPSPSSLLLSLLIWMRNCFRSSSLPKSHPST